MVHTDLIWDLTHFAKGARDPQIQLCLLTVYVSLIVSLFPRNSPPTLSADTLLSTFPQCPLCPLLTEQPPPVVDPSKVASNDPWLPVLIQSCPDLCDPKDCSPPGSSVYGILLARILEWVAMPSSRGSSWLRDWTQVSCVSCIAGRFLPLAPINIKCY